MIRQDEREMGREDGIKEGLAQGPEQGLQTGAQLLIKYDLEQHIAREVIIQKVHDIFGFQQETVEIMMKELLENQ